MTDEDKYVVEKGVPKKRPRRRMVWGPLSSALVQMAPGDSMVYNAKLPHGAYAAVMRLKHRGFIEWSYRFSVHPNVQAPEKGKWRIYRDA